VPKLSPGEASEFVALVDAMRTRGARRVRWGDFEVELSPLPAPSVSTPEPSRQDRERTARERDERDLFWSSSGTVPDPDEASS
jgi:hypothetical protein